MGAEGSHAQLTAMAKQTFEQLEQNIEVVGYILPLPSFFVFKFIEYIFRKHAVDLSNCCSHIFIVPYPILRQLLASLYSLNRAEAKLFLQHVSGGFEFLTLGSHGLKINMDKVEVLI